jgi:hypothetical protein
VAVLSIILLVPSLERLCTSTSILFQFDCTIHFYTSFMVYVFNNLLNDSELSADSLWCIGEYEMEKCHCARVAKHWIG